MKEEYLSVIRERMSRKFRLLWHCMSIDYPVSVVPLWLYPPPLELIQVARRPGICGFFRNWLTIGEIHISEDVVYLSGEYFSKYYEVFLKIIEPIKDHVTVKPGKSEASQVYDWNSAYNREWLNYHADRESARKEERKRKEYGPDITNDRPPY